jgi:hypothetical protein
MVAGSVSLMRSDALHRPNRALAFNRKFDTRTFNHIFPIYFYKVDIYHAIGSIHQWQAVLHWHERCGWKQKRNEIPVIAFVLKAKRERVSKYV